MPFPPTRATSPTPLRRAARVGGLDHGPRTCGHGGRGTNHLVGIRARAAKPLAVPDAWVYLLRCADGSLYTGWTVDLDARLRAHAAGTASAYTRSRLPVELALALPMVDRSAARREEARIKALHRSEKLALLAAHAA
jgi:putative endonuclease